VSASFEPLPHAYPFRFADRTLERTGPGSGRVRAVVTANARGVAGGTFGVPLVGELMAQAALLLEGGDPETAKGGFLAGFPELRVERAPEAGDVLTVEVRLTGKLGNVVKFEGTVRDGAEAEIARGSFQVKKGS
jgi:3-hydroxymyristoyl/3-hydroxydecanoyl-(acyl carrier protein) dehydratase